MPKIQTTVGFDEIFNFAEKDFNISWNSCNQIFFRDEILTYKSTNEISIGEEEHLLTHNDRYPNSEYKFTENNILAHKVLIAFMNKHNLDEMLVIND